MSSLLEYLPLFAGVGMFLFGMDLLAKAIERLAGASLEHILETLTSNKWKGLLLGTGVTAVIQSSAATTVTVVGFVNAGMMKLAQALPVVFGANIGSTATAQILRLGDLQSGGVLLSLLKPSTFAPILIIIGAAINLVAKKRKTKNIAQLLMGFGILFFGMTTMEETLAPLKEMPAFQSIFTAFENPVLGILAGLGLTALIQSSSAAVGILQALTSTGSVTFATTFPLLMGINIGKCLTVILASFGTNKNSKRTVTIHLTFNVIGAVLFTTLLYSLNMVFHFSFLQHVMSRGNVADLHTGFNVLTALILMPFVDLLCKFAEKVIPDSEADKENQALDYLDDRFLKNPSVAMEQCRKVLNAMGVAIQENLAIAAELFDNYDEKKVARLNENEHFLDKCEASVGEYLVRTTHHTMTEEESHMATEILQAVSDFERIGDYCVNISETAQYMNENKIAFTPLGRRDAHLVFAAATNIVNQTCVAFETEDRDVVLTIEPLEEVIDQLIESLRDNHMQRLQKGVCTVTTGISFIELLNNIERISDHCSNIAIYIIQRKKVFEDFDRHTYLHRLHEGQDPEYTKAFNCYREQYLIPLISREDWKKRSVLTDTLAEANVEVREESLSWQDAIKSCMKTMIQKNQILPGYCSTIIKNVEHLGAYYTTANMAIVIHANPSEGANQNAINLTLFKNPVHFPHTGDAPVRLFVCLSAIDDTTRHQLLHLMERIMSDREFENGWQTAEDADALRALLNSAGQRAFDIEE